MFIAPYRFFPGSSWARSTRYRLRLSLSVLFICCNTPEPVSVHLQCDTGHKGMLFSEMKLFRYIAIAASVFNQLGEKQNFLT